MPAVAIFSFLPFTACPLSARRAEYVTQLIRNPTCIRDEPAILQLHSGRFATGTALCSRYFEA